MSSHPYSVRTPRESSIDAAARKYLPEDGPTQVGSVALPTGERVDADEGGLVAWVTSQPLADAGRVWLTLAEAHAETGLVPVTLPPSPGGTGRHGRAIANCGYRAVGFDISADQLRFARGRLGAAVRADARLLPLRDQAVGMAVGMFFHTDVADFAAVVRDVARCLRAGRRFIYIGLHPCFIGPFVERTSESRDATLTFVAGYGQVRWADRGSGDGSGVGGRVGFHHKTLARFLGAITGAGLNVRGVREFSGGGTVLPRNLAVVAERPG
jgi:SAM-dependent methyltransferase